MPIAGGAPHDHHVVRRAKTVRGRARLPDGLPAALRLCARPTHTVERTRTARSSSRRETTAIALRLRAPVPVRIEAGAVVAEFRLRADESASFVLEQADPGRTRRRRAADYVAEAFKETVNFWRRWIGRSLVSGPLARDGQPLGAHPEAAHLAGATARSSPRRPSGCPSRWAGTRNWDYRYTWIRDASFTLYGLMRLGFTDGGRGVHAVGGSPLRGARARRLAADHVRHRRPPRPPRRTSRTSRATGARARCGSATPRTTSSSSTSTAS